MSSYMETAFPRALLDMAWETSFQYLNKSRYDVVFVASSSFSGLSGRPQLEAFIEAGGGLVLTPFCDGGSAILSAFNYIAYSPLNITARIGVWNTQGILPLDTRQVVPHAITSGLLTFRNGIMGYPFNIPNVPLVDTATCLARYVGGTPVISIRTTQWGSRTVHLNFWTQSFFAPSGYQYWDGQGDLIVTRALMWAAKAI